MLHYGLDVHIKYSSYCAVEDRGRQVAEGRVSNHREAFVQLFGEHPGPKRAVMESCIAWPHVYDLMWDLVDEVQLAHPLAAKYLAWDRIKTYMLVLRGPSKIDLLFLDCPSEDKPPWRVTAETLRGIDDHFWDWILWLASKHSAGKHEFVGQSFAKMFNHLLRPMGAEVIPSYIEQAVTLYAAAQRKQADRLGVRVPGELGHEVRRGLRRSGYAV